MEQNLQYTHIRIDNGLIKASFLHFGLNKEKKQMQGNSRNCKVNELLFAWEKIEAYRHKI